MPFFFFFLLKMALGYLGLLVIPHTVGFFSSFVKNIIDIQGIEWNLEMALGSSNILATLSFLMCEHRISLQFLCPL